MLLRYSYLAGTVSASLLAANLFAADLTIKHAPLPPTLDGVPDALWEQVESVSLDQVYVATPPVDPANCAGTVKVVWNEDRLFFLFEVSDDVVGDDSAAGWADDSVQLYFDADNAKGTSYDANDADLIMRRDDTKPLEGRVETAFGGEGVVLWAVTENEGGGGYTVEVSVAWEGFGFTPADGVEFGLDLQVNDDDGGNPNVVLKWNDTVGNGYANPSVFGTAILSDEEVAINADLVIERTPLSPTIDGIPDALWDGVEGVSLDLVYVATPPVDPANCSATVKTVWDDGHLYFLYEISDDALGDDSAAGWADDSAQLYFDADNAKGSSYDANDADLIMRRDDTKPLEGRVETLFGGEGVVNWAVAERDGGGGYTVEIEVAWEGFGFEPANGTVFGMDLQVNDDDGGNPDVVLKWHDTVGNGYANPSVFGTAILSEEEILLAADLVIKRTPLAPTIDGEPDALWSEVEGIDLGIVYVATPPVDPANCAATVKTVWDDDYLYFYYEVSDDVLGNDSAAGWADDSLQLYFDADNSKGSSYDDNDADLIMRRDDTKPLEGRVETAFGGTGVVVWAVKERDGGGGYTAEIAVAWDGFGFMPMTGTMIGLDLQVNDDDGGNPDVVLKWHDTVGNGYANPSVFGTAVLSNHQIAVEGGEEIYLGYPIVDGWINTGSWLGLVYVEYAPWMWSDSLQSWVFLHESSTSAVGGWIYFN